MPNTFDIPVVAIKNFFVKHDLPLRMSLDDINRGVISAATMRKVKFRANQLETRWEALFSELTVDQILAGVTGRVVADARSHLRIVQSDENLKTNDTVLASVSDVRLDALPADRVLEMVKEKLADTRLSAKTGTAYITFVTTTGRYNDQVQEAMTSFGMAHRFELSNSGSSINLTNAQKVLSTADELKTKWTAVYRALMRSGMKPDYARPVPTHDTSERLEKFIKDRRKSHFTYQATSGYNIETMPVANHGVLASRTWGIEVEAGGARGIEPPAGWDRKGDSSLHSAYYDGYNEDDYDDDQYSDDAETSDYWMSYDTGEFVSPILHSFHSKGLEKLTRRLQREPQNDSAGVHVHVDASDLSARQIGALILSYEMIEPLVEESYRRETRTYCKRRDVSETMNVIKSAKKVQYKSYRDSGNDRYGNGGQDVLPHGDRYVTLNLCALDAHGTVEFRAMGPVYEYEYLIKWALFCREMVNMAARNVPGKVWNNVKTFDDVRAVFAKYGSETPAIVFNDLVDSRLTENQAEYTRSGELVEV